jgi:hypothetical protein
MRLAMLVIHCDKVRKFLNKNKEIDSITNFDNTAFVKIESPRS